jgi:hypothetical protein
MPGPDIIVPILVFSIPIIAILVRHQQKMTELLAAQRLHQPNPEVDALRREVRELKQLVHQQTIQVDSLIQSQNQLARSAEVSSRLEG